MNFCLELQSGFLKTKALVKKRTFLNSINLCPQQSKIQKKTSKSAKKNCLILITSWLVLTYCGTLSI